MSIRTVLDREVSGEELMTLGFAMCAGGLWFKYYWIELSGFMFFFIGVLSLKPLEGEGEEEGHQGKGETPENPLGPRS